jgi:hypothetical protein
MMFRTSILAVSAVAAIALVIPAAVSTSAPALAASTYSSTTSSSAPSTPPGDPGNPGGPGGPGGGGNGGDLPTPPPEEQVAQLTEVCNAALSSLVKIPVTMVEKFQGGVSVVPVCNSGLGHKASIDNSQAVPLQGAIGDNRTLAGPLGKDGFRPEDVVGVVLIDGVATLYVHTGA